MCKLKDKICKRLTDRDPGGFCNFSEKVIISMTVG